MKQESSSVRDRLLARLPQPENLMGYREETASLLAKHEKALFWEKVPAVLILCIGVVMYFLAFSKWYVQLLPGDGHINLLFGSLYCMIVGSAVEVRYRIYRSKVDLLKEVKQLQLQLLEVQASLRKDGGQSH
jgi:MFS superfamily sulfate permease-like transporter